MRNRGGLLTHAMSPFRPNISYSDCIQTWPAMCFFLIGIKILNVTSNYSRQINVM